ncbi:MAG TPA: isoprenylcysteine carboxylmethyltransferase family protein [Acidiferrobacterales bacterium]|nr:isoprenylcysteine carboxylmethyltransferase family protein [Acidiferrobacterales bacterium]
MSFVNWVVRRLRSTSFRTFVLYPILTLAWELLLNKGRLRLEPVFLPLMVWGYLQYRLCGQYRIKRGGGGPGLDTPPERLVTTGSFAYTRNPMYLGHIIFLTGLALTLNSLFAALLTVVTTVWFHFRVLGDERRLTQRFGQPYVAYLGKVKRWVPGLF